MTTRELICRIAETYGKWPHEVAKLPLHYYRALKDEYVRMNAVTSSKDDDDEVVEFDSL